MSGIYGILGALPIIESNVYKRFYSSKYDSILNQELSYGNFKCGRSVLRKHLDDRVVYEDAQYLIIFEGILYNKSPDGVAASLVNYYQRYGDSFPKKLVGQFCGFIYDKKLSKLVLFNDHLSTKPLYVYKGPEYFIFSSELKVVTGLMTDLGLNRSVDYDAVYCMLTFGYMLNNVTYDANVKKLPIGTSSVVRDDLSVTNLSYDPLDFESKTNLSENDVVEEIDHLLSKAVSNEWGKDSEYGYNSLAFLSGGLDSRVNVLLAKELGIRKLTALTFSQSRTDDHLIAEKIAAEEGMQYIHFSLNGGKYLEGCLLDYVMANDGLVSFQGAAAGFSTLNSIKLDKFGLLHTGQIGDVLFGSFVKSKFCLGDGVMTDRKDLLDRISFYQDLNRKYSSNPERYSYEQRQTNNTLNGDRAYSHLIDVASPFYNRQLIDFCLSVPDSKKKHEAIYLKWINEKHPNMAAYKWEQAMVKPKSVSATRLGRISKRVSNAVKRRAGLAVNNTNPFDIWLKQNPALLSEFDDMYDKFISQVNDIELKGILEDMYFGAPVFSHYGRNNKFVVLTLISALQIHFGEKI